MKKLFWVTSDYISPMALITIVIGIILFCIIMGNARNIYLWLVHFVSNIFGKALFVFIAISILLTFISFIVDK